MNIFYTIFSTPLGFLFKWCYMLLHNYGLALLLFTLFTRLILLPFSIQQQRTMARTAKFRPKMEEIKAKYGNDKEKYQQEMMKLQSEQGYNPMSGCLPLLLQFPILFGLIGVVYMPLTYVLRINGDVIQQALEVAKTLPGYSARAEQIFVIQNLDAIAPQVQALTPDIIETIKNFNFTLVPGFNLLNDIHGIYIIIPVLTFITSAFQSWVSTKTTDMGGKTNWLMIIGMPLMFVWFTTQVPAAVGFYWICSSLVAIGQTLLLNKWMSPAIIDAKDQVKVSVKRLQHENVIKKAHEPEDHYWHES